MKRKAAKKSGGINGIFSGSGATMQARRTLATKGAPVPARSQVRIKAYKPRVPSTRMLTRSGLSATGICFHKKQRKDTTLKSI